MMVTTSILQLVLFVCIGTKFVHDIVMIIIDQLVPVDLIPDPHNIAYIRVMVAILVVIIVLVPMDKYMIERSSWEMTARLK